MTTQLFIADAGTYTRFAAAEFEPLSAPVIEAVAGSALFENEESYYLFEINWYDNSQGPLYVRLDSSSGITGVTLGGVDLFSTLSVINGTDITVDISKNIALPFFRSTPLVISNSHGGSASFAVLLGVMDPFRTVGVSEYLQPGFYWIPSVAGEGDIVYERFAGFINGVQIASEQFIEDLAQGNQTNEDGLINVLVNNVGGILLRDFFGPERDVLEAIRIGISYRDAENDYSASENVYFTYQENAVSTAFSFDDAEQFAGNPTVYEFIFTSTVQCTDWFAQYTIDGENEVARLTIELDGNTQAIIAGTISSGTSVKITVPAPDNVGEVGLFSFRAGDQSASATITVAENPYLSEKTYLNSFGGSAVATVLVAHDEKVFSRSSSEANTTIEVQAGEKQYAIIYGAIFANSESEEHSAISYGQLMGASSIRINVRSDEKVYQAVIADTEARYSPPIFVVIQSRFVIF